MNPITQGTYYQKVAVAIKLTDAFIHRLKNNQTYDNSVIIVMADHGYYDDVNQSNNLPRFNPILLIKGIGEKHELIKRDLPVSQKEDLMDAYYELLDGKSSEELFSNVPQQRTRILLSDKWIDGKLYAVDYSAKGRASEWEKFELIGNIYDCN